MTGQPLRVAVLSAGMWGSALAVPLTDNGHAVRLWDHRPDRATARQAAGSLHPRLPGLRLPAGARVTADLAEALDGAELVILAPAAAALRSLCTRLAPSLGPNAVLVSACKSLEPGTYLRMSEIVAEELPPWAGQVTAISGPNFAHEVAARQATTTVVAGRSPAAASLVRAALMTSALRVYTNDDICGVELGGALKNIIAIGAGVIAGLGQGDNAQAALATRGLAEITRLGMAMGANPLTFAGLSGLGDLLLSTTSAASRNRQFGVLLGQGLSPDTAQARLGQLVEGVRTIEAAAGLAARAEVEMPITAMLQAIVSGGKKADAALTELMCRAPAHELDSYPDR